MAPKAFANTSIHKGVLSFHDRELNAAVIHSLGVNDDSIVVDDRITYFYFNDSGSLMSPDQRTFIQINRCGKLVLTDELPEMFELNPVSGLFWKLKLSVCGDTKFEVCGDGLIGYKSFCDKALEIEIDYDLCWPFLSEEIFKWKIQQYPLKTCFIMVKKHKIDELC